jgi:UDP-GlcNAc:undecaprenyl-phosphate GlcNAc-1-phosphate transferase
MIAYLCLFLLSLALATVLTPVAIRLAPRLGAVDLPDSRKVHVEVTPRLGGAAVFLSIVIALSLVAVFFRPVWNAYYELRGLLVGALLIIAAGLIDDTRGLTPWLKMAFQVTAATVAVTSGIAFHLASNPFVERVLDYFNLGVFAFPLSVLWIVALTNAMNLIDGLDGLASGIALLSSLTLFLISLPRFGSETFFYAAVSGAALGFLRYNRYPAKVFLGDTGSMFFGYTLGCLSISGAQKSFTLTSILIPVIVFGVPLFDSFVAFWRRYSQRRGIAAADREHLHHRLMDLGLSQRQAVLLLYFITVLLGIIAFAFTVQLSQYAAVIAVVIGVVGGLLAKEINLFGQRRPNSENDTKVGIDEKPLRR